MQTTFFCLERFLKDIADYQCSSITKGCIYHIKHYVHTAFYYLSGLTWNCMFNNGSIYYVLYLKILHFYLVRQSSSWVTPQKLINFDLLGLDLLSFLLIFFKKWNKIMKKKLKVWLLPNQIHMWKQMRGQLRDVLLLLLLLFLLAQ